MSAFLRRHFGAGRKIPVSPDGRHRVVVVGGGFGGLPACRYLAGLPIDVTLIDRRNHHLFQPLLYQVATGILSPGQIAPPLRYILRRAENVRIELAEVTSFDLDRRVVHAVSFPDRPFELHYDSLIVATGSGQSYFGHDEFAQHAPGMKTIDDALEIRRRILGAFEMAETAVSADEQREWLTIAIVGAGPTGVEIAGQVRELATRSLTGEYRTFDPSSVRVLVVDAGKEPLPMFGDNLSGRATRELKALGVELRMDAKVAGVDESGIDYDTHAGHERIAARTVIWAAGVQASPLAKQLGEAAGAEVDHKGRVVVLPDLTLPGRPEVFVAGDMMTLGKLPGVAEVAMQGGLHAARTIVRRLGGDHTAVPFHYRDLGSVAIVGRFRAIASVGRLRLSGFAGWVVWSFIHIAFLSGWGNRVSTIMHWFRWLLGHRRPERVFSVKHTGGDTSTSAAAEQQTGVTKSHDTDTAQPQQAELAARAAPIDMSRRQPRSGRDTSTTSAPG